jgi:hypothetical protein
MMETLRPLGVDQVYRSIKAAFEDWQRARFYLGLGRLPGDIHFVRNGREYSFPVASSVLLSGVLTWLLYVFR